MSFFCKLIYLDKKGILGKHQVAFQVPEVDKVHQLVVAVAEVDHPVWPRFPPVEMSLLMNYFDKDSPLQFWHLPCYSNWTCSSDHRPYRT